jgi:hypothetical protein
MHSKKTFLKIMGGFVPSNLNGEWRSEKENLKTLRVREHNQVSKQTQEEGEIG